VATKNARNPKGISGIRVYLGKTTSWTGQWIQIERPGFDCPNDASCDSVESGCFRSERDFYAVTVFAFF
jgi:hypothetical protein